MRSITAVLAAIGLLLFPIAGRSAARAGEFPLSAKGVQATAIRVEGLNTSQARAVGKVTHKDAEKYYQSYHAGETVESGKKRSKNEWMKKILREEKGKLYTAAADCRKKTIKTSWGETFTLIGVDKFGRRLWRLDRTGETVTADDAPVVEGQFKMLCPAFSKP